MGARQKLNRAFFNGSLLLAGVVTESWLFFGLVLAVLLATNLYLGEIRPNQAQAVIA